MNIYISKPLRSDGAQGVGKAQTELYLTYCEGALEPATPQSAGSVSGAAGLAGRQADAVEGL